MGIFGIGKNLLFNLAQTKEIPKDEMDRVVTELLSDSYLSNNYM